MSTVADELAAFEAGEVEPAAFPHGEHLRLAFEMLRRHDFGESIRRFSAALKLLAAKAGRPQIYHETITVAFLALINERRQRTGAADWQTFRSASADLLDKECLRKWYSDEQLATVLARKTFCLPEPKR